ncbi:MAG: nuclear transport factor 2 family protein [Myxococcota bacterium]
MSANLTKEASMPTQAMAAVMRKDREAWLNCFSDEAILQDPVGGSPLDPEGKGLVGREALGRFWDAVVAPAGRVRFDVREEHTSGSSVARVATVHIELGNAEIQYDGVFVYDLGAEGRIECLRGYFEAPGS